MYLPASSHFAAACHEDVLHPLALAGVGERDDESGWRSKDIYWGSVNLPRFATHVRENAEARKPACEKAGDPVGENNIDLRQLLRQPSFAKPHQQHACGGDDDDDDDDGCGIHGFK